MNFDKMEYFRIYSYPKSNPKHIRYGKVIKNSKNSDGTTLAHFWQKECDKANAKYPLYFSFIEEVKP